jgi:predicted phage terminase large subunit-like protein
MIGKLNQRALVAKDFGCFLHLAFSTLNSKRLGNEQYLDYLCREIESFAGGKVRRLLINLPPRHLKTITASIGGTAWMLGHAPSTRVMIVTNGEELSKQIMRGIRTIMQSDWYQRSFPTRLEKGYQAILHFGTTAGDAVYSAPIGGALTGFGAEVIIVDDLHHIDDARNPEKMADDIDIFETVVLSRLNDPRGGRIMIIGHRIDLNDVSGHALSQGGWRHVLLPLVAPRDEVYETSNGPWLRRKGEFLRPDAWDAAEVNAKRARTRAPDFETLYQQNPSHGLRPITAQCFPEATYRAAKKTPLVMSIDPGQAGGPRNSFSVVQVWSQQGENHHVLIEQWRDQSPFPELLKACKRLIHRHRPSAIVIEMTGQGPALASKIRPESWMKIVPVHQHFSKVERLAKHIDLVCSGGIRLAIKAGARVDYVEEFVSFPRCDYTDQIDATTQYLDFIEKCPHLPLPPERALGCVQPRSSWVPTPPAPARAIGVVLGRSAANWPSPEVAAAMLARRKSRGWRR